MPDLRMVHNALSVTALIGLMMFDLLTCKCLRVTRVMASILPIWASYRPFRSRVMPSTRQTDRRTDGQTPFIIL